MIVCPNCNHQNPDGAVQCEACYTPLPTLATCPSCGASVQSDASFCGQCGFDLRTAKRAAKESTAAVSSETAATPDLEATVPGHDTAAPEIPDLIPPDPLVTPEPISLEPISGLDPDPPPAAAAAKPATADPETGSQQRTGDPSAAGQTEATQLQVSRVQLLHLQTNTVIDLPTHLPIIHVGKPNDRVPPTIDVSGFPNSEIVSRVHADIRVEGDVHYIEDVGSSNGTYINNMPLAPGNRHRLRPGDRVALGKGDKVTFIFQTA